MMKGFNALQLVTLFSAGPFIIEWLHKATFTGATAAFWIAVVVYVIGYIGMVVSVHDNL